MTAQHDLKRIIRERMKMTGESYTAARAHVLHARNVLLGIPENPDLPEDSTAPAKEQRVEAIVLKVNQRSARVRIPSEGVQVTFRSTDAYHVVPGHVVTLVIGKRWKWREDEYASGLMEDQHIDIAKLGLEPLPLHDEWTVDFQDTEPFRSPDPYAPLWKKLTAKPRTSFEMDPIAWGSFPDSDPEDNPTCDASELAEQGDVEGARELLMDALLRDLRCIDAHGHLGNLVFDRYPERAMVHYEIGIRIGELSLPPNFDGVLEWGRLYNRPFLRCLHGYGLCLWRLDRTPEAKQVFERIFSLNPGDNQGIRFLMEDLREGGTWEELREREVSERDAIMSRIAKKRASSSRPRRPRR